jgi:hypothetical protein
MSSQERYHENHDHTIYSAVPPSTPTTVNIDWDETLILPPPRLKGRDVNLDENRYLFPRNIFNMPLICFKSVSFKKKRQGIYSWKS